MRILKYGMIVLVVLCLGSVSLSSASQLSLGAARSYVFRAAPKCTTSIIQIEPLTDQDPNSIIGVRLNRVPDSCRKLAYEITVYSQNGTKRYTANGTIADTTDTIIPISPALARPLVAGAVLTIDTRGILTKWNE